MADRFPFYDLDGRLAADAAEIHRITEGHDEEMGRAYWDAFNALPSNERKVEGELYNSYVQGSAQHMRVKYADEPGQDAATIPCQNPHMARRAGVSPAAVIS